MSVVKFDRAKKRKKAIKCVFRFLHRPCVVAYCWTTEEIADAFRAAKGVA